MLKIFIDGAAGTTGLVIRDLLEPYVKSGILSIISIDDYKNAGQKHEAYAQSDLTILCLPDEAAKEAVILAKGTNTRILDASSAHRIAKGWIYGLPELTPAQPDLIKNAQYVSNPGCYATGAIAILRPLIDAGLLKRNAHICIEGESGYTGGGNKLIEAYTKAAQEGAIPKGINEYNLNGPHKHLKEIIEHAGLARIPIFKTKVVDLPRGMIVSVAFNGGAAQATPDDMHNAYVERYAREGSLVKVPTLDPLLNDINFSKFNSLNAKGSTAPAINDLDLIVKGWGEGSYSQRNIFALLDNLGKGAGTQALQNIRLMLDI